MFHNALGMLFSPSGEIGRHSGLKIRRFVNSGRTGSTPVSGTIQDKAVSNPRHLFGGHLGLCGT